MRLTVGWFKHWHELKIKSFILRRWPIFLFWGKLSPGYKWIYLHFPCATAPILPCRLLKMIALVRKPQEITYSKSFRVILTIKIGLLVYPTLEVFRLIFNVGCPTNRIKQSNEVMKYIVKITYFTNLGLWLSCWVHKHSPGLGGFNLHLGLQATPSTNYITPTTTLVQKLNRPRPTIKK